MKMMGKQNPTTYLKIINKKKSLDVFQILMML